MYDRSMYPTVHRMLGAALNGFNRLRKMQYDAAVWRLNLQ